MKLRNSEKGFSIVEVGLMVAVLALIGFIGFRVWSANQDTATTETVAQTPSSNEAPQIKKAADLDTASKALDSRELDSSSLDQLDSELNY